LTVSSSVYRDPVARRMTAAIADRSARTCLAFSASARKKGLMRARQSASAA
jgi:hypothetical protein